MKRVARIALIVGLRFVSTLCKVVAVPFVVLASTLDSAQMILMARNALDQVVEARKHDA